MPTMYRGFGLDADPFSVFRSLHQDCNRFFAVSKPYEDLFSRDEAYPRANVWSNEERAVISAELPGVSAEELELTVYENSVTLKGRRQGPESGERSTLTKRERASGEFLRSIELPFSVQAEGVEAKFKNGVLTVTLPRAEEEKPRKIPVRTR